MLRCRASPTGIPLSALKRALKNGFTGRRLMRCLAEVGYADALPARATIFRAISA